MTARLEIRDLSVLLGRHQAVRDVSLDAAEGTVVGVVGPNGAGKTTLVDAVSGFVPATGTVRVAGRPVEHLRPHRRAALGMARTFQSLELFEDLTVAENLAVAAEAAGRVRGDRSAAVARATTLAGLDDVVDVLPGQLSLGRRKQVALARALAARPDVLLLDEPAAGLDGTARAALVTALRALAGEGVAVVAVDHDVGLVLEVCDEVAVLDAGRVVAHGPPAQVRSDPAVVAAWLGRSSVRPAPRREGQGGDGPPVLEANGLSVGYGGVAAVSDLDLCVGAGEVVALLGANGAGKTTTLRAVSGALPPLAGQVRVLGQAVGGRPERVARRGVAHAPQERGLLPSLTVAEQLRLAASTTGPARLSHRRQWATPVESALEQVPGLRPLLGRRGGLLSGGEQQLLSLARALAARPRLLLVDELSLGLAPPLVHHLLQVVRATADDGAGVLLVEQFAPLALSVADRAYVLDRGRVVIEGTAGQVASRPELLEAYYLG